MPVNLGDLAASVARKRVNTRNPADNITTNHSLFYKMKKNGNFRKANFSGNGVVELFKNGILDDTGGAGTPNNIGWYNPYEVFAPRSDQEYIDGATFDFKQLGAMIQFTGADEIKWAGKEKAVELVSTRVDVAMDNLCNKMGSGAFADGTGEGGREMGGLQLLVQDDPSAAGTVGGIDQVTNTFWRNKAQDSSGSGAVTDTNVVERFNTLHIQLMRNQDTPDIVICDDSHYLAYEASEQSKGRYLSREMADAGFDGYRYKGSDVMYDVECPAQHYYMLNSKYLHLRYATQKWFTAEKARKVVLGDHDVVPIWVTCNMTVSNRALQGVGFY